MQIPVSEIRVNSRSRHKARFQHMLASISAVGLKKPIIVAKQDAHSNETKYSLVCGHGRMEALLALGETSIPAVVIEASFEDQILMSLVENIARSSPSNCALQWELRALRGRNYSDDQIAHKLGLTLKYVQKTLNLLEHGEWELVEAVERGDLPIDIAVTIANENSLDIQLALSEACEKGELRGRGLLTAKRMVARRFAHLGTDEKRPIPQTPTSVRQYRAYIRRQQSLTKRVNAVQESLILLTSALRRLFADKNFVALLYAEGLKEVPEQLAMRLK